VDPEVILDLIYSGIERLNAERGPEDQIPLELDTELFGENSPVDSLGLISIISDIEVGLSEEGHDLSLTDDEAVATVPWETVGSLRDYLIDRLA
jgi:acyl carrier protein